MKNRMLISKQDVLIEKSNCCNKERENEFDPKNGLFFTIITFWTDKFMISHTYTFYKQSSQNGWSQFEFHFILSVCCWCCWHTHITSELWTKLIPKSWAMKRFCSQKKVLFDVNFKCEQTFRSDSWTKLSAYEIGDRLKVECKWHKIKILDLLWNLIEIQMKTWCFTSFNVRVGVLKD